MVPGDANRFGRLINLVKGHLGCLAVRRWRQRPTYPLLVGSQHLVVLHNRGTPVGVSRAPYMNIHYHSHSLQYSMLLLTA